MKSPIPLYRWSQFLSKPACSLERTDQFKASRSTHTVAVIALKLYCRLVTCSINCKTHWIISLRASTHINLHRYLHIWLHLQSSRSFYFSIFHNIIYSRHSFSGIRTLTMKVLNCLKYNKNDFSKQSYFYISLLSVLSDSKFIRQVVNDQAWLSLGLPTLWWYKHESWS